MHCEVYPVYTSRHYGWKNHNKSYLGIFTIGQLVTALNEKISSYFYIRHAVIIIMCSLMCNAYFYQNSVHSEKSDDTIAATNILLG